jgi:hypothetical protein
MHERFTGRTLPLLLVVFLLGLPCSGASGRVSAQTPGQQQAGDGTPGRSQEVPFSDPTRPGVVRAEIAGGRLVVRGYAGRAVRISEPGQVRAEERDNVMRLTIDGSAVGATAGRRGDIVVEVPSGAAVHVTGARQASVEVEGIAGETRVTTDAGSITLGDVVGRIVAESQAGSITARFETPPTVPLSFSSRTGDIEVRLPPDTKADVRLDRVEGDFTSDFFIEMLPPEERQIVDDKRPDGRFHIKIEKTLRGRINGGGPELAFRTVSGALRITQAR